MNKRDFIDKWSRGEATQDYRDVEDPSARKRDRAAFAKDLNRLLREARKKVVCKKQHAEDFYCGCGQPSCPYCG